MFIPNIIFVLIISFILIYILNRVRFGFGFEVFLVLIFFVCVMVLQITLNIDSRLKKCLIQDLGEVDGWFGDV